MRFPPVLIDCFTGLRLTRFLICDNMCGLSIFNGFMFVIYLSVTAAFPLHCTCYLDLGRIVL